VIGGSLVQLSWRWVFWINIPVGLAAIVLTARVIPESRDEHTRGRPDLAGAALLALSVGLIALALVKVPGWGWGSASFLGLLAAAVACGTVLVIRSHRHHAPVIELGLLRSRMFSGTFAASILYYAGFGAFVLTWVEFLTGVWHYSAVRAGLAIAPGPLMVLPFARLVSPWLAARLGGPGRVAVAGALVNAAAQVLWYTVLTAHPAYLTRMLPVQLLGGAGVGLAIPSLIGAGSMALPPDRFGTGSGILNMARQIGTVLGVAGVIAILAGAATGPVALFRHTTILVAAFFVGAALVAAVTITARTRPAAVPAPARSG
jgi:MFS family permease